MTWRALSARPYDASHVILQILDHRYLNESARHDVASNVCQSLHTGGRRLEMARRD